VTTLIIPSQDALKSWCEDHNISWTSLQDMTHHPEVLSRYQHAIDKVNTHFSHIEQIKKFALLPVSWEATRNDGTEAELTPTMKLKRRIIMTKFSEDIDKLYI